MPKPFTIAVPRYRIENVTGDFFDVYNKRVNAINGAIKLAAEYPGNTFVVVKIVYQKRKIIFRFQIDTQFDLDDIKDVYQSIIGVYQKKLSKTRFWRKSDG
jgi:hypothetical protein